ncbi:hypothetical protein MOV98_04455 [Acinetobacter variabilis]|nr:hypothetical protein MOV98_04455 [Acinetobacter variabilis]
MKINSSNSALSAIKDLYFELKGKNSSSNVFKEKYFQKSGKLKNLRKLILPQLGYYISQGCDGIEKSSML